MKTTFVLPDLNYVAEYMADYSGIFAHSIGYLSAALKRAGHTTSLIHITRPPTEDEFAARLRSEEPDLVAFTSFSHQFPLVKHLAAWAKAHLGVPAIAGGVHATIDPEDAIAAPGLDFICRGEGEDALVELCERLAAGQDASGVGSIWAKENSTIVRNPVRPLRHDLDGLAFPDRSIFAFDHLADAKMGMFTVLATRGCPYDCTYCCNHQYQKLYAGQGRYVRQRSVENVLEEIEAGLADYPSLEFVNFIDDTFCLNRKWLSEFAEKYPRRIGRPFHGNSRVNLLTADTVELLKEAGCQHLAVGIESGDEEFRRQVLGRGITEGEITAAFALCRKAGIKVSSYNMVGLPFEDRARALKTVKLNAKVRSHAAHVSIFQPYPYTRLYDICVENGFISGKEVSTFFGESLLDQPSMSKAEATFAYKYFAVFAKLYTLSYGALPEAIGKGLEALLDRAYLTKHVGALLAAYPLVFAAVSPVRAAKRLGLRFAPNLSRRLKRLVFRRSYM